jgi:excinuclease ABC subunit B
MENVGVRCKYIHSEVKTLDRVEILRELRLGIFDVLVGVNLLREGLDLPEVSLVAIMDADKEGFLRNVKSLVQTIGRAARNDHGKVIMYADKMTVSMQRAIDETNRRRSIQMEYNEANGITPRTIMKSKEAIMEDRAVGSMSKTKPRYYVEPDEISIAADPVVQFMTKPQLEKAVAELQKKMEKAAKDLDFVQAAQFRDEWMAMKKKLG